MKDVCLQPERSDIDAEAVFPTKWRELLLGMQRGFFKPRRSDSRALAALGLAFD